MLDPKASRTLSELVDADREVVAELASAFLDAAPERLVEPHSGSL